ncbi:hypothetical protein PVK06_015512 [Gossypium arboreum]|uniref:Uncharacterized protein n=1 Tax=Gossypium arboreum TaxID=29729 RepID=A0ABR0PYE1_GOSAR|nr:hypothetical protein PVK06_015512 [Gossypium arboreum]
MLSEIEVRVGKFKKSIEDARESNNALGENIEDLREQSRDFVTMCLTFQRDSVQELLYSQIRKLMERNGSLEAMMKASKEETMATTLALSTRIEELEGELALYRAAVGEGLSSVALSSKYVPKPKEFVGTRSACDLDNFFGGWKTTSVTKASWMIRVKTTGKRQGEIGMWQEFQCELKGQF